MTIHWKKWILKWCKRAAVLASFIAVVEGGTWIWHYYKIGPFPTYKPRHLFDFYRFYRVNPDYRSPNVRVNSAGFRNDEEVGLEKPEGVYRIVMMGGSTVWGEDEGKLFPVTIDNRDTIASHLESFLNERARVLGSPIRVQVINAGVVGYLLFQNLTYFDHHVAFYRPDMVVAMDGHNDLDALQLAIPPYHHRNEAPYVQALNDPSLMDLLGQTLHYAEFKSLFIRRTLSRMKELASQRALQGEGWKAKFKRRPTEFEIQSWLDNYARMVRRFDSSTRISGCRTLFTIQVELAGERSKSLTQEEKSICEYYSHYRWLHTEIRDRLIARMTRLSAEHGIWFVDLTDAFRDEEQRAYLDYTHLTSRGAKVMAHRLASIIEPEIFHGKSK